MTAPDPARLHQSIRQLEGDGGRDATPTRDDWAIAAAVIRAARAADGPGEYDVQLTALARSLADQRVYLLDLIRRQDAALTAVRELHAPEHRRESRPGVMTLTPGVHPSGNPRQTTCAHCRKYWPCDTAAALASPDTAQEVDGK